MRHEAVYAKELNHEILAEYEEQQLLRETQAGDENAREKLILVNLRLVRSVAQKYENFELGVSTDDLMADGIVGLCKAISNFDLNFGTRLSTYATLAIHHAVARSSFLNGTIRLPEHVKAEVHAINNAKAALSREGQPLTVDTIAQVSQVEPEQVERLKHIESDVMYMMSLDEQIGEGKDALTIMDTVADENGEDSYHKVELEVDLDFFLSKLDAHERFVVERSYGIPIDMTNREIGDVIGYHHNDITGMLKDAMAKLKRLARALRGSVAEQKEAIENPLKVMTGEGEIIPLFNAAEVPLKERELKRRKRRETDQTDNGTKQLSLFE
ncbi:sigma-70 family RNA polymerase sigma factor [Candidatus Poribacteria bacterium]|nr:sigma-70 family RNA polymerase sigma factor [Candidatus Poribacteria bacterium]